MLQWSAATAYDDSIDDNAHRQPGTKTDGEVLPAEERRAAVDKDGRLRAHRKVFLIRVAQVRFLSGPPPHTITKSLEFRETAPTVHLASGAVVRSAGSLTPILTPTRSRIAHQQRCQGHARR